MLEIDIIYYNNICPLLHCLFGFATLIKRHANKGRKICIIKGVPEMVTKKNNKDALTAAEIKEIKQHLEELKADAEKRLKDKKNLDMPEAEVGDPIDAASQSLDKEILFELSGNSHNTIGQIEAALRKIEKGIYGRCELCRQPIPKKRIKALPFARYCVNCQHSSERHNG